jgi:hypothetical protein
MPGISSTFPGPSVTEYDNARACFNAVKGGNADAELVGLYSTTWMTNQVNTTTYNIIPISGISYDLAPP